MRDVLGVGTLPFPLAPRKSMRVIWAPIAVVVLSFSLVACKPTPEKVCRHLQTLSAENAEQCVPYFQEIQESTPQYWDGISRCILATQDEGDLHSCDAVVDLVRAQAMCDEVLDRLPDAYEGSVSTCLDAQHDVQRAEAVSWAAYEACVIEAEDFATIEACATPD